MNREAVFDLREHAVERIGGCGNHELGVALVGEESVNVGGERAVC